MPMSSRIWESQRMPMDGLSFSLGAASQAGGDSILCPNARTCAMTVARESFDCRFTRGFSNRGDERSRTITHERVIQRFHRRLDVIEQARCLRNLNARRGSKFCQDTSGGTRSERGLYTLYLVVVNFDFTKCGAQCLKVRSKELLERGLG